MKRSTNFRGRSGKHLTPNNLAALMERYGVKSDCAHCEYDRRFPGFEAGGWMQQDNNGPIVPCPVCNPSGARPRQ